MRWLVLALLATPALAEDPVAPAFVEEAAAAGITHAFTGEWEYTVGGGAAVFDCNDDGFEDLFLAGGEGKAAFYLNRSTVAGPLVFEAAESGLEMEAVLGAYPLDIDSDGVTDVVLLRQGENVVMRGLGACRFERANETWGFDGGDAWSAAFAATWERGQTWPTIAIGNYLNREEEAFPWGSCTDNWLHRPDGQKFAPPVPLTPSFCALSMLFTDWNRSGTPALRVSNDREYYKGGQEQMWRIEPGAEPVLYGEKDGWKRLRIWGMGIASTDLTGDGLPEYFLTSMADNKLQTVKPFKDAPKPDFADVAFAKGVTAHRPYMGEDLRPSTAWHAQFADVNNDGRQDLFVVKGNVHSMPDFAAADPNNLLLQREDGTFFEAGAAVASMKVGRGGAVADFNLDGQLDLVAVNRWTPVSLWRNAGVAGHWVSLRLDQPAPNRDAIGAWVELRTGEVVQRREVTAGGGHAGGQAGWLHFGLGDQDKADVRVLWPDGTEGAWMPVPTDGFAFVGRDGVQAWTPGSEVLRQP